MPAPSNGKRYEDWKIEDPEGRTLQDVLIIRDQLDQRVKELLADLSA
ncbi:hypothetical protein [Arthrobacter crystallopoietes]|nr:hypothetical protein [Arthrobacter crystallopoietes]